MDLVLAMELEERLVVGFRWHLFIDFGSGAERTTQ